ncbi:DUF11 domain-containing protein [Streptomyces roseicoloratus]|uniref:DUF11 domain-containing protein n=1 Tax=Streptomyces roseicoloratus TaxID=2508722 RepID=A0ABY9RQP2_9ACTN|nr:DUF11 domain-containing protein [Streptomyces roseicoloratus]WMX44514.1 DUF11 domain-containing protein [Streptomyces roseicoloratus]
MASGRTVARARSRTRAGAGSGSGAGAGAAVLRRRTAAYAIPGVLVGAVLSGASALPATAALPALPDGLGSGCVHGTSHPTDRQAALGEAGRRAPGETARQTLGETGPQAAPDGRRDCATEEGGSSRTGGSGAGPSRSPEATTGPRTPNGDREEDGPVTGRQTKPGAGTTAAGATAAEKPGAEATAAGKPGAGATAAGTATSGKPGAVATPSGRPGADTPAAAPPGAGPAATEPAPGGTTGTGGRGRAPGRADLVVLPPVRPRAVAPGETFDYRISVVNHGPAQARNAMATDTLPAVLSFVSSKDGCTAKGRKVTCGPVATLDPGQTVSWVVTVRLDPAYTGDGSDILNQATATSETSDPDLNNNTGPHPGAGPPDGKVERPRADVAVTKEFAGKEPVVPGTVFAYTLTVRNHGPSQATGVRLTDRLPKGLAFADSPDGCTGEAGAYGGTVACPEHAALAPDGRVTYTVRVRLAPGYTGDGSDLVNRVRAGAKTDDPNHSNNTAELTGLPGEGGKPAPASADLVLGKRYELPRGVDAVTPGDTYAYVMTVRNQGPSTARNVTVTDPLPRALSFAGSPDGCRADGATVTCGGSAALAPGETAEYRITVRLARDFDGDCATVDNTARVASAVHDPDTGNNTATVGKKTRTVVGDCGVPIRPRPKPSPTPTHDDHHHHHDHDHTLPDTGNGVPVWLPMTSGLALLAGTGLVLRARRRRKP